MHPTLLRSRVCDAASVPLALEAIFMPPNALGAMKVAALYDFRKEAKQKLRLPNLGVNTVLGADLSNAPGLPVPVPEHPPIPQVFIL